MPTEETYLIYMSLSSISKLLRRVFYRQHRQYMSNSKLSKSSLEIIFNRCKTNRIKTSVEI